MRHERRNAPRVPVSLSARWEGVLNQQEATVADLSTNGCFVLSGGKVRAKELIRMEIRLPEGEPIYLWAEVVDAAHEIGFGVRFTSCGAEDQERLARLVAAVVEKTRDL